MIQKGDTLLYKTGKQDQDVGLVLRVFTAGRKTVYYVHNGYGEEEVSPRQVLQVLKAVPSRRQWTSAPAEHFVNDDDEELEEEIGYLRRAEFSASQTTVRSARHESKRG